MKKAIAILAGEPNSIASEIIFKTWLKRKKFKCNPFFVIGNIKLLNKQKKNRDFLYFSKVIIFSILYFFLFFFYIG